MGDGVEEVLERGGGGRTKGYIKHQFLFEALKT